ncbi:hypothetical protein [Pseudomonas coleopterorum]|uniref:hypothetical protein n=1 Tax=Pseudomonas coleopterorum TaxID=1605838 RepID=UPI00178694D9|nr:hypothetical protein [Pseudomonas coleopterorum]MBD8483357.1 hypothetical protein [Pseudomonas coleopterorum]
MVEEHETPTSKRVSAKLDYMFEQLKPFVENGEEVPFSVMQEIFILALTEDHDDDACVNRNLIHSSFEILETLKAKEENDSPLLSAAMLNLLTVVFGNYVTSNNRSIEREMTSFKGLYAINKSQSDTSTRAQEIAKSLWAEDHDRAIRVGEMAQRVYAQMHAEGRSANLPKDAEALRKWIKPVAPPYSQRGGRARKPK